MPPRGTPPLSFMGLAFVVVMVSKHGMKVTMGARLPFMMIFAELAGLFVTHARFEFIIHRTLSPLMGL